MGEGVLSDVPVGALRCVSGSVHMSVRMSMCWVDWMPVLGCVHVNCVDVLHCVGMLVV